MLPIYQAGLVWIGAGVVLAIYATVGMMINEVPGVEQLYSWLISLSGWWIILAAFIAIFIEGLYLIGSVFPGSSIVVLAAVLAGFTNWLLFILVIIAILTGWVLAGIVNIITARFCVRSAPAGTEVQDKVWLTWFPAFRANQEVAQIVSGAKPRKVFWSSLRVKIWGTGIATILVGTLPLFIDMPTLNNEEGFVTLVFIAAIMLLVGTIQIHKIKTTASEQNAEIEIDF